MKTKKEKKVRWKEIEIIYICTRLLDICLNLYEQNIYHSDWKPANIALFSDENTSINGIYYIKLIDFGGATTDFDNIRAFTPFYINKNIIPI